MAKRGETKRKLAQDCEKARAMNGEKTINKKDEDNIEVTPMGTVLK